MSLGPDLPVLRAKVWLARLPFYVRRSGSRDYPEGTTNTQTHYSTSVIKKRRSNPSPDGNRNRQSSGEDFQASELQGQHHHSQSRNGYPSSGSQMLSTNMNYNNLGSSGSNVSVLLPEQKSIPRSAQQGRLMASYKRIISSSPK